MKLIPYLLQIPFVILYALREVIEADTEVEIIHESRHHREGIFFFPHRQIFQ
jgi:hypothetical protein